MMHEIGFDAEDFTETGLRKLAAMYSHSSGIEIAFDSKRLIWPSPVIVAQVDLDEVNVVMIGGTSDSR